MKRQAKQICVSSINIKDVIAMGQTTYEEQGECNHEGWLNVYKVCMKIWNIMEEYEIREIW